MASNRILFFFILIFTFCSPSFFAQKTTKELGNIVFSIFKNNNFDALDTLTPKSSEIIEILKNKYSSISTETSNRFIEKYDYHNKRFKKRCKDIRNDTTEIKLDWKNASHIKTEFHEQPLLQDSTNNSKPILINYLELYIVSGNSSYILEFKEIYFHKGIWKLGEHIRFKKT